MKRRKRVLLHLHVAGHVEGDSSGGMDDVEYGEVEEESKESGEEDDEEADADSVVGSKPGGDSGPLQQYRRRR